MKEFNVPCLQSSLSEWLFYIKQISSKSINLGLERIFKVAAKLNLLEFTSFVITVGGTNGKGTTCRLIEMILIANKISVGVYNSPHLLKYTERVRIQGKDVAELEYIQAMDIIESNRGSTKLSYFEFSTLVAFFLLQKAKLDVIILEVGLGGRLDATNIINSNISVITNIDIDHSDFLGNTVKNIAIEKSGIFRYSRLAIVGEYRITNIIENLIKDHGAYLFAIYKDWWYHEDHNCWCWWDKNHVFYMLPIPKIPLINAATALAVINSLPFTINKITIYHSLRNVSLPGRFQIVNKRPLTILDVAHNPHAVKYLSNKISKIHIIGKIIAILGMRLDKDINLTISSINNLVTIWYFTSLQEPNTANAAQLANYTKFDKPKKLFNNIFDAWYKALENAQPEDCILVFGSFYTVAPIINLFNKKF